MDNTILLGILSDHLHRRKTTLPASTDMTALAELARRHQVDGIVYAQCGSPPIPSMAEAYSAAAFYYANRTRLMATVAAAFAKKQIPYCTVKGLNVAKYYPVPALRTMGDCDIVVPPEHMGDAVETMQSLGFVCEDERFTHEWSGTASGLHVEVHDQLIQAGITVPEPLMAFFNDFMPYVTEGAVDDNFHFLFLLAHLRKHWVGTGIGIRPFFDLAVILQNGAPLNAEWIREKLDDLGLKKLADVCFSLVQRWFSVRVPIAFDPIGDDDAARVTELVLQNSMFADKDDSIGHKSRYAMGKGPIWYKNLVYLLQSAFPPYGEMTRGAGLSYLDGRPWLLPVAWVHRWFRLLFRKDKTRMREKLDKKLLSKSEIEQHQAYLKDLGIE